MGNKEIRKLTEKDNLNRVMSQLPDKKFDYMIRMSSGINGKIIGCFSFEQIAKYLKEWSAEMIADGVNFLVEQANKKQVFYPIYAEDAMSMEPSKRKTGLACFLQDKEASFAIVCAGGGYESVASIQEAFPVAKELYERGYHVFVLQYRCGKNAIDPNPMDDLANAVRFIFNHTEKWKVNLRNYAVIGFSAGGHLAASFGTEKLGYTQYGLPKPGVIILGYPVVTMGEYTHAGSRRNLLGKAREKDIQLQGRYSIENLITADYPKTYVWQCDHDNTVPIQNTQMLVASLHKAGVNYKYETFPSDAHGWGLGKGTPAEGWIDRAIKFW